MESKYDGTCKGPEKHTWKAGDEVFYDKTTKAICNNGECFKQLKAAGPQANGKTATVPVRTNEERFQDAVSQLDQLWTVCWNKAVCIYHPEYTMEKASEFKPDAGSASQKECMILAQCLFKGLSMGWSRP